MESNVSVSVLHLNSKVKTKRCKCGKPLGSSNKSGLCQSCNGLKQATETLREWRISKQIDPELFVSAYRRLQNPRANGRVNAMKLLRWLSENRHVNVKVDSNIDVR